MSQRAEPRILIVEDEPITALDLSERLSRLGFCVVDKVPRGEQAISIATKTLPDIVLMDIKLQGRLDGVETAVVLRKQLNIPTVFLTAYPEDDIIERSKSAEPYGYIIKPYDERELKTILEMALFRHNSEKEINRLNRLYLFISQVNQAIVRVDSEEELFKKICAIATELGGYKLAWIGLIEPRRKRIIPVAYSGDAENYLENLNICIDEGPTSAGLTATAIKNKKPYISRDYLGDDRLKHWWELARVKGFKSAAAFPLFIKGDVVGALMLYSNDASCFTDSEIKLLEEVSADISFALNSFDEAKRRIVAEAESKEKEQFNRQIVSSVTNGIVAFDADLRITLWNAAMEKLTGIATEEVIGKNIFEAIPFLSETSNKELLEHAVREGGGVSFEKFYQFKDSNVEGWAILNFSPLKDAENNTIGGLITFSDVTPVKRLQVERERIFTLSPDIFIILRADSTIEDINPSWESILGWGREETVNKPLVEFVLGDYRQEVKAMIQDLASGESRPITELPFVDKFGTMRILSWNFLPATEDGVIYGVARDLTEKVLAERRLQDLNTIYLSLVENLPLAVFQKDINGRYIFANSRFCEIAGLSLSEIVDKTDFDIFIRPVAEKYQEQDKAVVESGQIVEIMDTIFLPGEKQQHVQIIKIPVKDKNGNIRRIQGIIQDVTKEIEFANLLRLQSAALEAAGTAIMIAEVNGKILWVNKALEKLTQYSAEEVIGKPTSILRTELGDNALYKQMSDTILAGEIWNGEFTSKKKDGSSYTVELTVTPIRDEIGEIKYYVAIQKDVSLKKQLEMQIHRGFRLQSVATFTSAMAHDINNALTPIVMAVSLLRDEYTSQTAAPLYDMVLSCVSRISDFVKEVLAATRGIKMFVQPLKISEVINSAVELVRINFPKEIVFKIDIPEDIYQVNGDLGHLQQAINNLFLNSRDAMPDGGVIRIMCRNFEANYDFIKTHVNAKNQKYVLIEISDTGSGISPEHIERIFDPFFTTKEFGKGFGLGLTVVQSIVKSHGGVIDVESVLNKGTTFRIYLPAV